MLKGTVLTGSKREKAEKGLETDSKEVPSNEEDLQDFDREGRNP